MSRRSHARLFEALSSSDKVKNTENEASLNDDDAVNKKQSVVRPDITAEEYYQVCKAELSKDLEPYDLGMIVQAMAQAAKMFVAEKKFERASDVWTELKGYMEKQSVNCMYQQVAQQRMQSSTFAPPRPSAKSKEDNAASASSVSFQC